jgi:UDP-3-O-[3-hydroxymyristoyl] glucosamine N-acyltransferase
MLMKIIADALPRLRGDGTIDIKRLVHPSVAEQPSDLALAMTAEAQRRLAIQLGRSGFSKRAPSADRFKSVIVVEQVRTALATLTRLFDPGPSHSEGIHPTAIVAPDAKLGEGVSIGPYTVIGPRSHIGPRTAILSNVSIGADVVIGEHGLIHSGVRVEDRVTIGHRVIVHSNAVIGSDGFGLLELGPRMPYRPN